MNVFSLNWWLSTLAATIVTMIFIYLIKKATAAVNVPVLSNIAQEV